MRLAGWPQLFLAVFAIVCFVLWTRWLRRRKWWLYAGAMAAYLAALFSQPTACFVAGLLLLPLLVERALWRPGASICIFHLRRSPWVTSFFCGRLW